MSASSTIAPPITRITCPPGCKNARALGEHEFLVDADGTVRVQHEVDFGPAAFGNVLQRFDGRQPEVSVTVDPGEHHDADSLEFIARELLRAAAWLDQVAGEDLSGPDPSDVEDVRELLDLMETFANNDQRARYLLASNWLRDRGAIAGARLATLTTDEAGR